MTREDWAVIAFLGAVPALLGLFFVLAVVAVGRLAGASRQRSYVVAAGAFGVLVVGGLGAAFWAWGVGFDYADTFRDPPALVESVTSAAVLVAAGAYLGLLATGLLAHRAHRRHLASA